MAEKWDEVLYKMASTEADFECGRCRQPEKWMYGATGEMLNTEVIVGKSRILKKPYDTMQYDIMHYDAIRFDLIPYIAIQYNTIQ
eukprot:scaffold283051_cov22-Prasinocladus_malaysianus.AAC.1